MEQTTLDLCLFGEGGGDAPAGDAAAEQPAAEAAHPSPGKEEAFDRLISGEYRDAYVKRTQQMIDTRFKQSKELEGRMNSLRPVLEALAARYGMDAAAKDFPVRALQALTGEAATAAHAETSGGNAPADAAAQQGKNAPEAAPAKTAPEAAAEASLSESTPEASSAAQAGTASEAQTGESNESDPAIHQPDPDAILRRMQAQNAARFARRAQQHWQQEAQQLRTLYPGFDLAAEVNSPNGQRLLGMLRSGVPMRTAYQALHMDELLPAAIRYAVQQTQQRTVDSIRARGLRPEEAAAGNQTAAAQLLGADPARWNAEEMNDAIRQARMGKKIYL